MSFHKQYTNISSIQAMKQNTTSTLEFPLKTLSSCYLCPQKDIHYGDFHDSLPRLSFVLNISNIKYTLLYLGLYVRFINIVASTLQLYIVDPWC